MFPGRGRIFYPAGVDIGMLPLRWDSLNILPGLTVRFCRPDHPLQAVLFNQVIPIRISVFVEQIVLPRGDSRWGSLYFPRAVIYDLLF